MVTLSRIIIYTNTKNIRVHFSYSRSNKSEKLRKKLSSRKASKSMRINGRRRILLERTRWDMRLPLKIDFIENSVSRILAWYGFFIMCHSRSEFFSFWWGIRHPTPNDKNVSKKWNLFIRLKSLTLIFT